MPCQFKNFLALIIFCALLMLMPAPNSAQNSTAIPTLELRETSTSTGETVAIPWQSGLPLRSFDPQDRAQVNLAGEWQKERFDADDALTMAERTATTLAALETEIAGRQLADYDASA